MRLLTLIDDNNNRHQHINRILYEMGNLKFRGTRGYSCYFTEYGYPHIESVRRILNKSNFYITNCPISTIFGSNTKNIFVYMPVKQWQLIFNERLNLEDIDTQHPFWNFRKTLRRLSTFIFTIDPPLIVSLANKYITEKQLDKLAKIVIVNRL